MLFRSGGGVTADLARKILLGNLNVSGRFFLDLDEMVSDPIQLTVNSQQFKVDLLTTKEIEEYIHQQNFTLPVNRQEVDESMLQAIINAAHLAPSGGNNQPWRFHYQNKILHLFLEESATQAYLDPNYISSYTSIGSAIENLLLSAAKHNLSVNWELTPSLLPKHVAWFSFSINYEPSDTEKRLADQIEARHTNRKITPKQELDPLIFNELSMLAASIAGAKLKWLSNPTQIQSLASISAHTDLLRMFIPEAHSDFIHKEMRWDLNEVNETEDGIGIHTLDLSNNDQIGLRLIKDRRTIDFLQQINGGSAFKRLAMQQLMSSSAIGLITLPKTTENIFINGGRAAEKVWLAAAGLDLQIHPINVSLIFFYRNSIAKNLAIPETQKAVLTQLEQNFNELFENTPDEQAIFMFRIFKASSSPERTIRKPTPKIFSIGRA